VLCFAQDDDTLAGTLALADVFRQRGAKVFVAAPGMQGSGMLPVLAGLPALCTPLLIIQSFYRAASGLALLRGFNPDVPPHLNKVTETV
jgi:glucosamine--fructose-6-phosphate aminotransferase (isomerizing)